jgi:hypothetical protein
MKAPHVLGTAPELTASTSDAVVDVVYGQPAAP